MGGVFFVRVFRFVQICLDWSGIFAISGVFVQLGLDESRFVRIILLSVGANAVVLLLDGGQVEQEESQFPGGGDGPAVLVGFGLGVCEDVELICELVCDNGAQDVIAVEAEVLEVGVDRGGGAAEAPADLSEGKSLAVEVMGLEHAVAAPGGGRLAGRGHEVIPTLKCTDVLYMVLGFGSLRVNSVEARPFEGAPWCC